jgi:RHS repeat-associated core domain
MKDNGSICKRNLLLTRRSDGRYAEPGLYRVTDRAAGNKYHQIRYNYAGHWNGVYAVTHSNQDGFIENEYYQYDNGHLGEILLGSTSVWKLNGVNDFMQPTAVTTGPFDREYGYDDYGLPTFRSAGDFHHFRYYFNTQTGNLSSREDWTPFQSEYFHYDNLNRLTYYSSYGREVNYDGKGNITSKSDAGDFIYNTPGKPYAVSGIATSLSSVIPQRNQSVTYTSFKRPLRIEENGYTADFTYNDAHQRVKMELKENGNKELTRYYMGGRYEIDDRKTGGLLEKLYIGGDYYSAPAVYVRDNSGSWQIYYIVRDYQGSVTHITDNNGEVIQKLSYDAWGNLRTPTGWAPGNPPNLFLGRGYTGHEHLQQFGLINMNARLYDPVVGRFLSPDPYVQAPEMTQNFNRYTYAMNNPLKYTDPDGEFWHIVIGAAIGGFANWATHGFKFNAKGLGYFGVGAAVGAGSAALGGWVVGATQSAGIITGAAVGAGTGAVTGTVSSVALNGLNNVMGGQNFWNNWQQSAISGAIGGAISGGIAGGMKGYELAKEGGKNMWWGGDVKHGRTQWSLLTSEKPYKTIHWDIDNVGSKNLNDCVPTSFAEANDFFGETTSYDEYKTITNYQENVGVLSTREEYQALVSDNFRSSGLNGAALADPAMAQQIQNGGGLVHANMPHNGMRHVDNLRSIKYYHSGKIVMKFRIGSYKLSSVDNNWWFHVLKGVR